VGRGGRGHGRGDRFPRVLRPGDAAARQAAPDAPRAESRDRAPLRPARRGRGDPALELPERDRDRDDVRDDRDGQHGRAEARQRDAGHGRVAGRALRGRAASSRGRAQLSARAWRRGGRCVGGSSADALRGVHRQQGGGHPHPPARSRGAPGPEVAQAHDPGDGREGRDPRG